MLFAKLDNNFNEVPLTILTEPMIYVFNKEYKKVPAHFDGKMNRSELIHFLRNRSSLGSSI